MFRLVYGPYNCMCVSTNLTLSCEREKCILNPSAKKSLHGSSEIESNHLRTDCTNTSCRSASGCIIPRISSSRLAEFCARDVAFEVYLIPREMVSSDDIMRISKRTLLHRDVYAFRSQIFAGRMIPFGYLDILPMLAYRVQIMEKRIDMKDKTSLKTLRYQC